MVCHAIGRCRICARKHRLPIFGSKENQHALIEKVNLQLIILNTVCIDCIEKFERFIKEKETIENETSTDQGEKSDAYQSSNDNNAQYNSINDRPTMHFYVESNIDNSTDSSIPYENERLSENDKISVKPVKHEDISENTKVSKTNISENRNKENEEISTIIRGKKKRLQCRMHCEYCEKEFTHRGDLKRHNRKHTGEKPYECNECKKKFSQLSNLSRHRLVHSGERPFACAQCGQSYSRKGRLINHIGRELCRRKIRIPPRSS